MSIPLTRNELKDLIQFQRSEKRAEFGYFIAESEKLVREVIASGWEIDMFVTTEAYLRQNSWLPETTKVTELENLLRITRLQSSPEVLAVVKIPQRDLQTIVESKKPILVLDGISDPGNLGTIIRTADWFGINSLLLTPGSVDPYNAKVVRASMGSLFRSKIVQVETPAIIAALQEADYQIIVTDVREGDSKPHSDRSIALVLGSESHGVSKPLVEAATSLYHIPGFGQAESLNVAISGAIALYDFKVVNHYF